MDGRRNNGGHSTKGKAGRRSLSDDEKLLRNLQKYVGDEKAFEKLNEHIEKGNFRALQLYFNYRFGKPKESYDISAGLEFEGIDFKSIFSK